jgi:hypothetical protein
MIASIPNQQMRYAVMLPWERCGDRGMKFVEQVFKAAVMQSVPDYGRFQSLRRCVDLRDL